MKKYILLIIMSICLLSMIGCNNKKSEHIEGTSNLSNGVQDNVEQQIESKDIKIVYENDAELSEENVLNANDMAYDEIAQEYGEKTVAFENENVLFEIIAFDELLDKDNSYYKEHDFDDLYSLVADFVINPEIKRNYDGDGKLILSYYLGTANQAEYYINNDILSIMGALQEGDVYEYPVINLNTRTKKFLSDEEIISISGRSINEVQKIKNQADYNFSKENLLEAKSLWPNYEDYYDSRIAELDEWYNSIDYEKGQSSLSIDSNGKRNTYYFNELNHLCFIGCRDTGAIAGVGGEYYLYDIDLNEEIEYIPR